MLRKFLRVALAVGALTVATTAPTLAQSVAQFPYEKICDGAGFVAVDKLIFETRSEVDANKFVTSTGFKTAAYRESLAQSFLLNGWRENLRLEKGRFYSVTINGHRADTIDIPLLVNDPKSHRITCVEFGKPSSLVSQRRAELAKRIDAVGEKIILRKDVENIDKPLASAAPAEFSINDNEVTDNRAVQSNFAVATEFKFDFGYDPNDASSVASAVPLLVRPYVRHTGAFNSNSRIKDVDNLGAGLVANLYAVPITSWLESSFYLRGEYLTDTVNDKEIFASEFSVEPISAAGVRWPIDLQRRIYFDEIAGGPSIRFDLTGRVRYGWIEDSGPVTTLQSEAEYLRVGLRFASDLDLGGSDSLTGLKLYGSLVYFDNVVEATGLNDLFRFDVGIRYDFTKNFGLKVGYEKGRNEDTLQEVDLLSAAVTIKFGDAEQNKAGVLATAR